jgi:hypothetical protein
VKKWVSLSLVACIITTLMSACSREDSENQQLQPDGDLWPTAWSNDDYLYTANGDGRGFDWGSHGQTLS